MKPDATGQHRSGAAQMVKNTRNHQTSTTVVKTKTARWNQMMPIPKTVKMNVQHRSLYGVIPENWTGTDSQM